MPSDAPGNAQSRELTSEQKRAMVQTVSALVVSCIAEDTGVSIEEAFSQFYASSVAAQLDELDTLLYREGPGYIYDLYLSENADKRFQ